MSETIWGIIITGVLTLGASLGSIILANEFNNRRFKEQLEHDRDLKKAQLDHDRDLAKREREMSLRTDIYLAAAEGVSVGLTAISNFADLDGPYDDIFRMYIDKAPSINKVFIIGKEETLRALLNFTGALDATFLRLSVRRYLLVAQKQQIERLRAQESTFLKENSRSLEQQWEKTKGRPEPHAWDEPLQNFASNFASELGRHERATYEADALNATLKSERLKYTEECFGERVTLGRLLTPVLFSIRKELELPIDETEFRRIDEEASDNQVERIKKFIQEMQSLTAATGSVPPPAA